MDRGLLSLPFEVLHYICVYLSVGDVLSCCLTCHYLRHALNDNVVWKRYLPEQDISKLESLEQHVKPEFQAHDSLTPLCENRVHLMRKTRLLRNWKEQNIVEYYSTDLRLSNEASILNDIIGKGSVIYKDNYLFFSKFHNQSTWFIKVWDITGTPFLFTSIKIETRHSLESFHVIDTYLVVNKRHQVEVYLITIPEKDFPFVHSIVLEENEFWIHGSHSIIDHYLVRNHNTSILDVWDVLNGSKIGSFQFPVDSSSSSCTVNVCSHVKDDWLLQNFSFDLSYYLDFNIKKGMFSGSVLKVEGDVVHTIKYNSYIIPIISVGKCIKGTRRPYPNYDDLVIEDDIECIVYDFNTSVELRRRRFNNVMMTHKISSATVVNGTFVLFSDHHFKIIDVLTLDTVVNFEPDDHVFYIDKQLNVFESVFVVICDKKFWYELWDIQKGKNMFRDISENDHECSTCIDYLCTKLVLVSNKKIRVLHFW